MNKEQGIMNEPLTIHHSSFLVLLLIGADDRGRTYMPYGARS